MNTGLLLGLVSIVAFSLTLPMPRVAITELDVAQVAVWRGFVAALVGATLLLLLLRPARPRGRQWVQLAACAFGVVFGFPVFTTLAMQSVSASHGAVVVGLLPLATAVIGYAYRGLLARTLSGWSVACWSLVISLPILAVAGAFVPPPTLAAGPQVLAAFIYLALVSQLIGFFAWYRALALAGIARVSQIQLLQLFMTVGFAIVAIGTRLRIGTRS